MISIIWKLMKVWNLHVGNWSKVKIKGTWGIEQLCQKYGQSIFIRSKIVRIKWKKLILLKFEIFKSLRILKTIKRDQIIFVKCSNVGIWMNVSNCMRDRYKVIKEHKKFEMIKVMGNFVKGSLKVGMNSE